MRGGVLVSRQVAVLGGGVEGTGKDFRFSSSAGLGQDEEGAGRGDVSYQILGEREKFSFGRFRQNGAERGERGGATRGEGVRKRER